MTQSYYADNSLTWVIGGAQGSGVDSARTFSQELVLRLASTFSVIENIILISKVNIVTLLSEFPMNLYILMST